MSRQPPRQISKVVGANLRAARLAAGLDQRDTAKALGIESFQISRWERGIHRPSDQTLFALANLLGRDFAWFFTDHAPEREAA